MSQRNLVDTPQNPVVRVAYVFSPTAEMEERFSLAQADDEFEFYEEPVVIVTERLQWDSEVEGWRPVIRRRCIDAFRAYLVDDVPHLQRVLGHDCVTDSFDRWWSATRCDCVDIKNDWSRAS